MKIYQSLFLCAILLGVCILTAHAQGRATVTEAVLETDYKENGKCPARVVFKGKITTVRPVTVKYSFVRSDGARAPIYYLDFDAAGTQTVSTEWTLGDARLLPVYDGWQKLVIYEPNSLESSPAKFTVKCESGDKRSGNQSADSISENYLQILPTLNASQKEKFETELKNLKTFAERHKSSVEAAQKKINFDAEAVREELNAIAAEKDESKRAQRRAEFQNRFEPQLLQLAREAGIDAAKERQQLASLLSLGNATRILNSPDAKIITLQLEDDRQEESPPPAPAPDTTEQTFRAPFTSQGVLGERSSANAANGEMNIDSGNVFFANSQHRLAFVAQSVTVPSGVRRVRVFANLDPVRYSTYANGGLLAYSSAEAVVNLRVLEGSRVVASDRISLGRAIAVLGGGGPSGTRPVALQCEFTRSAPDDAATYTVIAEIEGWAGAGGLAAAFVMTRATLRQMQIYQHRR